MSDRAVRDLSGEGALFETLRGGAEIGDAPIERRTGHAEIAGDLRRRHLSIDQPGRGRDLARGEPGGPPAEVAAGGASLRDGVSDALAFDVELHLRESCHDGEDHRPHRGGGVDVTAAEVQDAQGSAAAAELLSEVEHVLRRPPEPVERRDHERVTFVQRFERSVELGPARSSARDAVIDVEVVTSDTGAEEVSDLAVGRLLAGGDAGVADELGHSGTVA